MKDFTDSSCVDYTHIFIVWLAENLKIQNICSAWHAWVKLKYLYSYSKLSKANLFVNIYIPAAMTIIWADWCKKDYLRVNEQSFLIVQN